MIVRKKEKTKEPKLTEQKAVICLASHFEWFRNLCFPNVFMYGGEMDLAVLTPSGYLWEIEIKISLSDWKADEHKYKWRPQNEYMRSHVSKFYYAVPNNLIDKIPSFVPKEMGIIEIYWNGYSGWRTNIVRPSTMKRGQKIGDREKAMLMRKVYFKYWTNKYKEGDR